jgi:hypothetical protein
MSKKRKHKKAAERRRRELERLQAAIEEQRAAAPEPEPESPAIDESLNVAPLSGEEIWELFQDADLEGAQTLFQKLLDAGKLSEDMAFEMLMAFRQDLDTDTPEGRARYAQLIADLRQKAPDVARQNYQYFGDDLVRDAVCDRRWDALPELMQGFVEDPEETIETFTQAIDELMYHGQRQTLISVMQRAWPAVKTSDLITEWAIDKFANDLTMLMLFDYLESTEAPQPDATPLIEATAPYGEWQEGWLERHIPHLATSQPSDWQPEDFGEDVDAEQWADNIRQLVLEFVAEQHREGVPYTRLYMGWPHLVTALKRQMRTANIPRLRGHGRRRTLRRRRSAALRSLLFPEAHVLENVINSLFGLISGKLYHAAALVELLPAYLHFLARLGLIHPKQTDYALNRLKPQAKQIIQILEAGDSDPIVRENVARAWSDEALQAIQRDPALADARDRRLAAPSQPQRRERRPDALQTYTFKVTYLRDPDIWRTIEVTEEQTLHDLHHAILNAVRFDSDHLYSFYLSGEAWDKASEFAHPRTDAPNAMQINFPHLSLRMKQEFLYLFDYGDEHRFNVQLVDVNPDAPQDVDYPRLLEKHGPDPDQYSWGGAWDEEWEEEGAWVDADGEVMEDDAQEDGQEDAPPDA